MPDLNTFYRDECLRLEKAFGEFVPQSQVTFTARTQSRIPWEAFGLACDLRNVNYCWDTVEWYTKTPRCRIAGLQKVWFPELVGDRPYSRYEYTQAYSDKIWELYQRKRSQALVYRALKTYNPSLTKGIVSGVIYRKKLEQAQKCQSNQSLSAMRLSGSKPQGS
jgi:hypothetical protein